MADDRITLVTADDAVKSAMWAWADGGQDVFMYGRQGDGALWSWTMSDEEARRAIRYLSEEPSPASAMTVLMLRLAVKQRMTGGTA